jgi:hypothetical protein
MYSRRGSRVTKKDKHFLVENHLCVWNPLSKLVYRDLNKKVKKVCLE